MLREIEERSLNAWPASRQLLHDGWLLRFSGGFTRRANSVNVLHPGSKPVEGKIAWCEEQYQTQQLPTIFKITPATLPEALDQVLDARGYRREAETEVLFSSISSLTFKAESNTDAVLLPRDEWHDAYCRITGKSAEQRKRHQAILNAIVPAVCPVAIQIQDTPVAFALGVLERGMVGIYDVFTDERYRRQGCATRLLSAILSWAVANGALDAYLQVMAANAPALALYTKLGFKLCYRYWYRIL